MELGECDSKCEHLANTPLSPDLRERLHRVYLSKGVHATTAIEGNTLSEEDVRQAVEKTLQVPESKEYLKQEVDNIIEAINVIGDRVASGKPPMISSAVMTEYNTMVLRDVPSESGCSLGSYRKHAVRVGQYFAPPSHLVPTMMDRLCNELPRLDAEDLPPRVRAMLKAIFAHLYVAWIHPFADGNGRVARLLEFDILLRSGVPSPAAHLLSNHYNQTRSEYYRRLDEASRQRDAIGFVSYAIKGFRDGLREQLADVNEDTLRNVWINYVHERFSRMKHTNTNHRQRELVLALTQNDRPIESKDFPTLSRRLHEAYRTKTDKTITRDTNRLIELDLIRVAGPGPSYEANVGLMKGLMPLTA